MKWMEFGSALAKGLRRTSCETPLLAEMPETRQHFFLFFPDFLFLPVVKFAGRTRCQGGRSRTF